MQAKYPEILTPMLCFPNAKINLGLNIISKREDGFHNIETIFCPVALSDILEFVPEPGMKPGECIFNATGIPVDSPGDKNLVVRAYHLLCRDFNLPAVRIHLHKLIPPGAGLGGGSSDAAFMLQMLDKEFKLKLDEDTLYRYAGELGSDCGFFLKNKPIFAYERGNRFRELYSFPEDIHLIIINPRIHISTGSAYEAITPHKPVHPLEELIRLPVDQWKHFIINDFEQPMINRYPVIKEIREKLYGLGAVYASMSGSGSSVFGLFREKVPAINDQFPDYFTWSGPDHSGQSQS
jgi:4-diphosphocytidyl-2-C-methyl-D-erythritol kinase